MNPKLNEVCGVSVSVSVPLNLRLPRGGGGSGNRRGASVSVRSEQSTEGGSGLDIWLGRGAMVGFAVAISVEIATGKGLLEVTNSTSKLLSSEYKKKLKLLFVNQRANVIMPRVLL